jgi:hypothetical protein
MPAKPTGKDLATTPSEIEERFWTLVAAVNAGDQHTAKELHACCRAEPALWDRLGGLEHNALDSWKTLISPGASHSAALTRDHIDAELAKRRKAFHGDGDSQLETLLINRILSAWLQVMYADTMYAQMHRRDGTFRQMEYAQKRLERANRQLIRAIQALATVRRLLRPTQVNIGQNQINVAR